MDEDPPSELHILTLNVWGLKVISKQRSQRLLEIGRRIAHLSSVPHIVALQECFCAADYEAIRRETRFALPYGKFYYGGAFGTGLVILSRWPIEESSLHAYALNGRPTAVTHGDWYVSKGVACARIRYGRGEGEVLEVFNTHAHSRYPSDGYEAHRLSQAWQLSKLLDSATARGHLVLGLGDLNMEPCSPMHRIISARAPRMRDVWRLLHPDSSLGCATDPAEQERHRPIPTAEYNITENGAASDNVTNTWRWPKSRQRLLGKQGIDPSQTHVPDDAIDERAKRLDYVFANVAGTEATGEWEEDVKLPSSPQDAEKASGGLSPTASTTLVSNASTVPGESKDRELKGSSRRAGGGKRGVHFEERNEVVQEFPPAQPVWVVRSARVGMMDRHPELGCSLSDHYSVEVTLVRRTPRRPCKTTKAAPAAPPLAGGPKKVQFSDSDNAHFHGGGSRNGGQTPGILSPTPRRPQPQDAAGQEPEAADPRHGAYLESPTASERRDSSESALQQFAKSGVLSPFSSPSADLDNLPLSSQFYDDMLSSIRSYTVSRQKQQKYRGLHFVVSICITIGLLVGVWWVPPYAAFVMLFVGMFNFAAGVLDGLYALLFLGAEVRKLREFEWEVQNAKAAAAGVSLARGASRSGAGASRGRGV